MRKWHRWLSVFFGVVLLWMAGTGVASQVAEIVQNGGIGVERAGPPPGGGPRKPSIVGTLHHLHSGEAFGPAGTIVSMAGGAALIFFTASGMWMYLDMFRRRRRAGKDELFWK